MQYVPLEVLALVEVRGKHQTEDNKQCWSEMKIIQAWRWEKPHSVKLAIFAAELVIDEFEKEYPNDDRPRKAIEAAKRVLKHDTEKNRNAASAAWSAAWNAANAASEAWIEERSANKILNKCEHYIHQELLPSLKEIK